VKRGRRQGLREKLRRGQAGRRREATGIGLHDEEGRTSRSGPTLGMLG
jgi:hypothetical protein